MSADDDPTKLEVPAARSVTMTGGLPGGPFFQRTDWLSFGVTTTLVSAVYICTLAPNVGLDNSGVWATAAAYGGVSSPPGYPLWTLWGWIFTKLLPFSNIAWRVAVSSAVAGALACGLIALMVSRGGAAILEQRPDHRRLMPWEEKWLRAVSGYTAGMVYGLNGAFWPQATKVAVWPLSILLLCLFLGLLMRWLFRPEDKRYLYLAALAYGLLLANSQIELALAPAIPFLVMTGNRKLARDMFLAAGLMFLAGLFGYWPSRLPGFSHYQPGEGFFVALLGVVSGLMGLGLVIWTRLAFTEWKAVLICGGVFVLGLIFYLYLPVASMPDPPVNWSYPRTVEGFFHLITRGQFESAKLSSFDRHFLEQVRACLAAAGRELGWPYLLPALIPFCSFHRLGPSVRRWILGLVAAYFGLAFLMVAVLNPSLDRQTWEFSQTCFSASYVVLALWLGYGLVILGPTLGKPRVQKGEIQMPRLVIVGRDPSDRPKG